jgi:hypothetical protein
MIVRLAVRVTAASYAPNHRRGICCDATIRTERKVAMQQLPNELEMVERDRHCFEANEESGLLLTSARDDRHYE